MFLNFGKVTRSMNEIHFRWLGNETDRQSGFIFDRWEVEADQWSVFVFGACVGVFNCLIKTTQSPNTLIVNSRYVLLFQSYHAKYM